MEIHQLEADAALASLRSANSGLDAPEAAARLAEYGPNALAEIRGEPLALRFFREFTHFFALILWLAAMLAFAAEWWQRGQGMLSLGFAILGVILINGIFSFAQEYRAQQAIAALKKLLPRVAQVVRERQITSIPAENLVPGDLILLEAGDDIPADCRLIEAFGVRVNNATVTGESRAVAKNAAAAEGALLRAKNIVLAGTTMVSGQARALVFATGMHTEFGKIAHLTQIEPETASPLQLEIKRLSRQVALLATLFGTVFFMIGQLIGLPFWDNLLFGIGIIVALVPEGLLPTVTLSLAMATQRMAKRNALVRHLAAVEALGATTVICTDKTGTLTQNVMSAKRLYFAEGFTSLENPPETKSAKRLYQVAHNCHSVRESGGKLSGDPMEIALVKMSAGSARHPLIDEIPFDAERRRMSTIHDTPEGQMLYCKGALEALLPICSTTAGGEPLTDELRERFLASQQTMADHGLRVLAFACREQATEESGLCLLGLVGLEDPPRPEVPDAIRRCHNAGIKVIMVTGDQPHTAASIGREIGLIESDAPMIITGEQLAHLSISQLTIALDAPEIIFARVAADQKMRIVNALKQKHQIVAVTGDGVNDAPALKAAHIGIAMGGIGTDVAREASDMILLDDNFASIVAAIEEGRAVFENIRKFLTYILASNIAELVPYLAFVLFRIPLPLSIIQILSIDLGTDMLPALALGAEKPDPDIMQSPPRRRHEKLLNLPLMLRSYAFMGSLEAAAGITAFLYVLNQAGWQYGTMPGARDPHYLQATTACLAAIIVMQLVNAFNCRDAQKSVFSPGRNNLLLFGMAFELLLIHFIVYTPIGNDIFGTSAPPFSAWLIILPFAALLLALEEGRKWLVRIRQ